MRAARVVITARSAGWARTSAQSMTGFATSVIGCKVEAGIETELEPEETPHGRPRVSVLLFAFDAAGPGPRLRGPRWHSGAPVPPPARSRGPPRAGEPGAPGRPPRH